MEKGTYRQPCGQVHMGRHARERAHRERVACLHRSHVRVVEDGGMLTSLASSWGSCGGYSGIPQGSPQALQQPVAPCLCITDMWPCCSTTGDRLVKTRHSSAAQYCGKHGINADLRVPSKVPPHRGLLKTYACQCRGQEGGGGRGREGEGGGGRVREGREGKGGGKGGSRLLVCSGECRAGGLGMAERWWHACRGTFQRCSRACARLVASRVLSWPSTAVSACRLAVSRAR